MNFLFTGTNRKINMSHNIQCLVSLKKTTIIALPVRVKKTSQSRRYLSCPYRLLEIFQVKRPREGHLNQQSWKQKEIATWRRVSWLNDEQDGAFSSMKLQARWKVSLTRITIACTGFTLCPLNETGTAFARIPLFRGVGEGDPQESYGDLECQVRGGGHPALKLGEGPSCWGHSSLKLLICLTNLTMPGQQLGLQLPPEAPPISSSLCKVHPLLWGLGDWARWEARAGSTRSPLPVHPLTTTAFVPLWAPLTYDNIIPSPQSQKQQLSINFFTRSPNPLRPKRNLLYHMTHSSSASLVEPPVIHRTFHYLKFTNTISKHHFSS